MNFWSQAISFGRSYVDWVKAGKPKRPPEERAAIFESFCSVCPYYDPEGKTVLGDVGKCSVCGCHVSADNEGMRNKLNWPTEGCPLTPPRFRPSIEVEQKRVTGGVKVTIGTINGKDPRNFKKG